MSLISNIALYHQGCPVVLLVDTWNHIISYGVHKIFTMGGCHTTLYRRYSTPMHFTSNKYLHDGHSIISLGTLYDLLSCMIVPQCLDVVHPLCRLFVWYNISLQYQIMVGEHRKVNFMPTNRYHHYL